MRRRSETSGRDHRARTNSEGGTFPVLPPLPSAALFEINQNFCLPPLVVKKASPRQPFPVNIYVFYFPIKGLILSRQQTSPGVFQQPEVLQNQEKNSWNQSFSLLAY